MSNDMVHRRKGIGSGLAVVVSGPSGAGKNSVINRVLQQTPGLSYSVSYTTRPARAGETDGVDYVFVDGKEFDRRIKIGDFIEHVAYLDDRYGTSRSQIDELLAQQLDVILNIDVEGAKRIRQTGLSDLTVIYVFLVPRSLERLEERLRSRGTETNAQISDRLAVATRELEALSAFEYLVINDELDVAASELQAIIEAERCRLIS